MVATERLEDLNAQVRKEALFGSKHVNKTHNAFESSWPPRGEEPPCRLKAGPHHRHASIARGRDDRGDDEGDRLAVTFRAGLPGGCRAQTPQAEAGFGQN